jgi:transcriptional regulator with XRE-family HTH domain
MSQYENGEIEVSTSRLQRIAAALGVRPGTLFPRKRPDEKRCQAWQDGATDGGRGSERGREQEAEA